MINIRFNQIWAGLEPEWLEQRLSKENNFYIIKNYELVILSHSTIYTLKYLLILTKNENCMSFL